MSKPSFTFDDCTKYAIEYEQTEDQLGTHKKNTSITVNSVTAQDSELSPGKQINQTAIVCDHCDKPGHRACECIMLVEKLPTHKIPKWYLDKPKKKQQHNSKGGKDTHGKTGGYGQPVMNQPSQPFVYPYSAYPPPVPQDSRFCHPPPNIPIPISQQSNNHHA